MFDSELVLAVLTQIQHALETIAARAARFNSADEFANSTGTEARDSICMLFMAIGEALKKIDKLTGGTLLSQYSEIEWCHGLEGHYRPSLFRYRFGAGVLDMHP